MVQFYPGRCHIVKREDPGDEVDSCYSPQYSPIVCCNKKNKDDGYRVLSLASYIIAGKNCHCMPTLRLRRSSKVVSSWEAKPLLWNTPTLFVKLSVTYRPCGTSAFSPRLYLYFEREFFSNWRWGKCLLFTVVDSLFLIYLSVVWSFDKHC